jgi:signal transduction histidine kinase/DNA-binding NarL/FixJ family response regulator
MARLNVLLVEDCPDDADLIALELGRGGWQPQMTRVETAQATAEALAAGGWDLVLSDWQLPGFGGMEALQVLHASGRDLPFILVSGAIGEEVAVEALKAGVHGYVLKHRLHRLCQVVERELKEAEARREQVRAREELRLSEERYRGLFEHSPIPLSVQDFSEAMEIIGAYRERGVEDLRAFFREHPEELRRCAAAIRVREGNAARSRFFLGQDSTGADWSIVSRYSEGSWAVFREALAALAEGATAFRAEMPIRAADDAEKVIALHFSVSPGSELALGRVLVSFLDVTERIRMEAALRDLDRLAAKEQMAAYLAHEINNPLAGIKNAFALLEPGIDRNHPHRRYADLIKHEIDRIAGIIRTLYHVYRPHAAAPGPVALEEVFQDIRSLLIPKCRAERIRIVLDLPDPGLKLFVHNGMLRQVIFNLAQNAVEASPPEGTVTLGARRGEAEVEITVRDQGSGVPPEWAERIFEPGFTSKRGSNMSGLGLGLSTCKSIVGSLGGSLDFASGGPGCTFRVTLPEPAGSAPLPLP